jgi:hypothetical protein
MGVKVDTLHLVVMNLEFESLVVAEAHRTEKTGQIVLLLGCRIKTENGGFLH